jgi:hypothetical protein
MQTLAPSKAERRRPLIADVFIAVTVGLVAALAKRHLDFHLGIPGHAGVGWIAVLVSGALIIRRPGMATIAGVTMALWGVPVGLNHSLAYNALLYGLAGAVLDSRVLLRLPLHRPWGALIAGITVHLAKFAFVFANAWIVLTVRNVEIFGFVGALANHLVFGALGGVAGWALWRYGDRARASLRALLRRPSE